jgi:two-component system nitrogen regulation response regulator NtrX
LSRILIVDDVVPMADQYAYDLKRLGGWQTRIANGGAEALEILADGDVDCVLLDLEMPGLDGFDVLRTMQERGWDVPVIVYTGTGDFDRCVRAIRLGAFNFVDKAEPLQRVVQEVRNALERGRLVSEVRQLRARVDGDSALIGNSAAMQRLRDDIRRVAPIPSAVLIVGESGSGKELVARDLHNLGPAPDAPFIAVNCAALPENLVESELFGHERGAFTGADRSRRGAFELAGKGTLFLDEIGELPLPAQAKLLRVLEARQFARVGAEKTLPAEARVIAATHRDLDADTADHRFREDLLFRLNVHVIHVPPLRDRTSDIAELAHHFIATICRRFGMRPKRLDDAALHALMHYHWRRNNVRELRNIIERTIIAADQDTITAAHVPPEIRGPEDASTLDPDGDHSFQHLRAEAERRILLEALTRNDWHITRTAQELGLADHASLLKIMRRHGIARPGKE